MARPVCDHRWGPTGHWESPTTSWGAPIEDDSARKALLLEQRYRRSIASDTRQGLGSFVFLWGDKQERTSTWYGLFLPSGEATPSVDTLQLLWTGRWPTTRAPTVSTLTLNDQRARVDRPLVAALYERLIAGGAPALHLSARSICCSCSEAERLRRITVCAEKRGINWLPPTRHGRTGAPRRTC